MGNFFLRENWILPKFRRFLILINMYVCINLKIGAHSVSKNNNDTEKKRPTQIKMTNKYSTGWNESKTKRRRIGARRLCGCSWTQAKIWMLVIEPTEYTIKMDYWDRDWFFIQIIIRARVTNVHAFSLSLLQRPTRFSVISTKCKSTFNNFSWPIVHLYLENGFGTYLCLAIILLDFCVAIFFFALFR